MPDIFCEMYFFEFVRCLMKQKTIVVLSGVEGQQHFINEKILGLYIALF
jgi:hypothetical protein